MSQGIVSRPQSDKKKIHSRNEFELCYLRHQYIRKTDHNPTQEEMKPYQAIASHMAKNTYFTYKNLFGMVGFESEDLVNIANVHLISFLGLFSLEKMPDKYKEFVQVYQAKNLSNPQEEDILNKNKANCTLFLKQRMEDVVRICRQKVRNIKGMPAEEFYFYCGHKAPPRILRNIVENPEKYGFKKLDNGVYKAIRKRIKKEEGPVFRVNGVYYVAVPVEQKILSLTDFCGAGLDPYDNIHNMNPEEALCLNEETQFWNEKHKNFVDKRKSAKRAMVRKFIEKNSKNTLLKEEVRLARKLLKNLEILDVL